MSPGDSHKHVSLSPKCAILGRYSIQEKSLPIITLLFQLLSTLKIAPYSES